MKAFSIEIDGTPTLTVEAKNKTEARAAGRRYVSENKWGSPEPWKITAIVEVDGDEENDAFDAMEEADRLDSLGF